MQYTLSLDFESERFARVFFSLVAFDFLWFGYLSSKLYLQFSVLRHRVAALMVYLLVSYALAVGISHDYLHSLAWCASVAVLTWGVCNAVLLNVFAGWSRTTAYFDLAAGIVNCCVAGAVATAKWPPWYPIVALLGVMLFLIMVPKAPEMPGGSFQMIVPMGIPHPGMTPDLQLTQATATTSIVLHIHGATHPATVGYSSRTGLFIVQIDGVPGGGRGKTYRAAVLMAAKRHDQSVDKVTPALSDDVSIAQIRGDRALQVLKVT